MTVAYWPTSESPPIACKKTLFPASNKYHCYISIKPWGRRGLGDGGGGHSREWKKLHRGGMRKDGGGKGTGGPGLQCLVGRPNTPSRSGASEWLEAPHKGKMTRAVHRVDVGGRRRRLKSIKPLLTFPNQRARGCSCLCCWWWTEEATGQIDLVDTSRQNGTKRDNVSMRFVLLDVITTNNSGCSKSDALVDLASQCYFSTPVHRRFFWEHILIWEAVRDRNENIARIRRTNYETKET